jgi:hypothetical protein
MGECIDPNATDAGPDANGSTPDGGGGSFYATGGGCCGVAGADAALPLGTLLLAGLVLLGINGRRKPSDDNDAVDTDGANP